MKLSDMRKWIEISLTFLAAADPSRPWARPELQVQALKQKWDILYFVRDYFFSVRFVACLP